MKTNVVKKGAAGRMNRLKVAGNGQMLEKMAYFRKTHDSGGIRNSTEMTVNLHQCRIFKSDIT